MKIKKAELTKIAKRLSDLEVELKQSYGLKNISGAFVSILMNDYTDDLIYISIRDGVQDDCIDNVHEEEVTLDRHTLEFKN